MDESLQKNLAVKVAELPPMVSIDKWVVCDCELRASRGTHLFGAVYGHPRFPDGEFVHTSRLLSIEGNMATCNSRPYRLLTPAV